MPGGLADLVDVQGADALLHARRALVRRRLLAEEVRHERHHAGVDEQQVRVVEEQRSARDDGVPSALEEAQPAAADLGGLHDAPDLRRLWFVGSGCGGSRGAGRRCLPTAVLTVGTGSSPARAGRRRRRERTLSDALSVHGARLDPESDTQLLLALAMPSRTSSANSRTESAAAVSERPMPSGLAASRRRLTRRTTRTATVAPSAIQNTRRTRHRLPRRCVPVAGERASTACRTP